MFQLGKTYRALDEDTVSNQLFFPFSTGQTSISIKFNPSSVTLGVFVFFSSAINLVYLDHLCNLALLLFPMKYVHHLDYKCKSSQTSMYVIICSLYTVATPPPKPSAPIKIQSKKMAAHQAAASRHIEVVSDVHSQHDMAGV